MTKRANGEGSLYRQPNGRWVAQVDLGWVDGKRRRKYVTAPTRAEAHKKLRAVLAARDSGSAVATSVPTVAIWFATYLDEVACKKVRPSTLARYRGDVTNHVLPALGRKRLDQLQPGDLSRLYDEKLQSGLSATSVRHLHAVIRRALNVACKWQLVGTNVANLVDPPRAIQTEVEPLSREEAQQFLAATAGDRLEARWAIGIALGLRQGEALGLRWTDVDLEAGHLRVRRALQRQQGKGLVFTDPKTARSRRTIPLPEPIVVLLRHHRTTQLEERLRAGSLWCDTGCVFATVVGAPIDPRADWANFKRLLRSAGLRDVRLHDLRHTAASTLLLEGVPARVVMEILGHSQISLTLNTYSHVAPEMQVDAVERLSAALWGRSNGHQDEPAGAANSAETRSVAEPVADLACRPTDKCVELPLLGGP